MEAIKGLYHAGKTDEATFKAGFSIRLKEFAGIMDNLHKQKKKPLQHFLITGKRGMGKSALLRRIYIEAREKPLSGKLIAVLLSSEQYKLSRLYKLWEDVIKHLSANNPALAGKREKLSEEKNYEEHVIHIIIDYLHEQNKTLLLLIDNFDRFMEKLSSKEQHTLREILIQYPVQIIGNAVFYDEHFFRYDKPFYDFFKPVHLRSLNKDEAEKFIQKLADNESIENFDETLQNQKSKIETLRILSGGVPRTLVILLHIVSKKNSGDIVDYLNEMLEQVTPLYQDRMKALSSQQQEIMHHLAIHWDRTSAGELAKEMRLPSKSISAQLSQLEDIGYINKITTSKRNHFYEIDERFFNIWLLMSEASVYDTKRVIWLTKWLDMFYESKELEEYAMFCYDGLKKTKPANRFLIMQALSKSSKLDSKLRDRLVHETEDELAPEISEVRELAVEYNAQEKNEIATLRDSIVFDIENKEYDKALYKIGKLKDVDKAWAYYATGIIYSEEKNYDRAEKNYLMAIEKGNEMAMNNLSILYYLKNAAEQKAKALEMIAKVLLINQDSWVFGNNILLLLWNEKIKEAYTILEQLLQNFAKDAAANEHISNALVHFLVFKQKQMLYRFFTEKELSLKDRFKPVYFALVHELKKELPDEYLKMPEEFAEPVNDLLTKIQKERERLGIKSQPPL